MNPRENLAPPQELAKPLDQQAELIKQSPETVLPGVETGSKATASQLESLQQGLQEVNSQIVYAEQQLEGLKSSLRLSNLDQIGRHIRGFEKQATDSVRAKTDYQNQIDQLEGQQAA